MIILSIVYVALPKKQVFEPAIPNIVSASQDIIIKEISLDNELKLCITHPTNDNCNEEKVPVKKVGDIIEKNQPIGFDYAFNICSNPICTCTKSDPGCKKPSGIEELPSGTNVYMSDVFVSSVTPDYESTHKIVRFWMWKSTV